MTYTGVVLTGPHASTHARCTWINTIIPLFKKGLLPMWHHVLAHHARQLRKACQCGGHSSNCLTKKASWKTYFHVILVLCSELCRVMVPPCKLDEDCCVNFVRRSAREKQPLCGVRQTPGMAQAATFGYDLCHADPYRCEGISVAVIGVGGVR